MLYFLLHVFKFLNKVVSPLPGKTLFSAFYSIYFIKIRSVLNNLPVPFAGCQAKIGGEEERGDGRKGNVTSDGKFWPLRIV